MIPVSSFNNQRVALFGLGGSGLATAQALAMGGAEVVAWDDNPASVEKAKAQNINCIDLRNADWSDLAALVLAPGVPLTHPAPHWTVALAHENDVPIIGDVELFQRALKASGTNAKLIAITGTNGKSTTTALTAHMLKTAGLYVQMGGNIGTAVLLLDPPKDNMVYVVECSSYQIDLAPGLSPDVGMLLNLTPDHLDRHGTMENYAEVKSRLVAKSQQAIISTDDTYCHQIIDQLTGKTQVQQISTRNPVSRGFWADTGRITKCDADGQTSLANLKTALALPGNHNAQNALAAGVDKMTVPLSVSETHSLRNVRRTHAQGA